MPKVTFVVLSGEEVVIEDGDGDLMSIAVQHGVEGIQGDCGGVCSCGTCHVHVDAAWIERTGPASDDELEILDYEDSASSNSRLGCQVELTPELDGLVVRVVGQ